MKKIYIEKLDELEKKLNYKFTNVTLLQIALTHRSFAHENNLQSYERLEFLGDSILEYVTSKYLYERYPNKDEGFLTKLRSQVVCKQSLSQVARDKLGLQDYISIGKTQNDKQAHLRSSLLEDVFEAIVAAIALDSNLKCAKDFILSMLKDKLDSDPDEVGLKDYKTNLQEFLQKDDSNVLINYEVIDETGPDHNKVFVVKLEINGKEISTAEGKSKKQAQMRCAQKAIEILKGK